MGKFSLYRLFNNGSCRQIHIWMKRKQHTKTIFVTRYGERLQRCNGFKISCIHKLISSFHNLEKTTGLNAVQNILGPVKPITTKLRNINQEKTTTQHASLKKHAICFLDKENLANHCITAFHHVLMNCLFLTILNCTQANKFSVSYLRRATSRKEPPRMSAKQQWRPSTCRMRRHTWNQRATALELEANLSASDNCRNNRRRNKFRSRSTTTKEKVAIDTVNKETS